MIGVAPGCSERLGRQFVRALPAGSCATVLHRFVVREANTDSLLGRCANGDFAGSRLETAANAQDRHECRIARPALVPAGCATF